MNSTKYFADFREQYELQHSFSSIKNRLRVLKTELLMEPAVLSQTSAFLQLTVLQLGLRFFFGVAEIAIDNFKFLLPTKCLFVLIIIIRQDYEIIMFLCVRICISVASNISEAKL